MEFAVSSARLSGTATSNGSLNPQEMVEIYRLMYLSRKLDDREILLKRQQKIFFQISGAGHEALQVGAGLALRAGYDWFFPYYRDRALCLALGMTPEEMLLQAVGAATDPASGGRQMPTHWSSTRAATLSALPLRLPPNCCMPWAAPRPAGTSAGTLRRQPRPKATIAAYHEVTFQGDEVVLTCLGEGSTSQGEFWEALNTASNQKLPVIFLRGGQWLRDQCPGRSEHAGRQHLSAWWPTFPISFLPRSTGPMPKSCLRTFQAAAEHCRAGLGPAFVHGHCVRPYSHSLSDDDKLYRSAAEREADALRDPMAQMQMRLLREGILSSEQINELEHALDRMPPKPPSARLQRRCRQFQSITATRLLRGSRSDRPASFAKNRWRPALPSPEKRTAQECLAADHGRPDQCLPARRDAARSAHRGLWRRRGRCQPGRRAQRGEGQGRSFQADGRVADGIWLGAGLQFAAGRGEYCGPGGWLRSRAA